MPRNIVQELQNREKAFNMPEGTFSTNTFSPLRAAIYAGGIGFCFIMKQFVGIVDAKAEVACNATMMACGAGLGYEYANYSKDKKFAEQIRQEQERANAAEAQGKAR